MKAALDHQRSSSASPHERLFHMCMAWWFLTWVNLMRVRLEVFYYLTIHPKVLHFLMSYLLEVWNLELLCLSYQQSCQISYHARETALEEQDSWILASVVSCLIRYCDQLLKITGHISVDAGEISCVGQNNPNLILSQSQLDGTGMNAKATPRWWKELSLDCRTREPAWWPT